MAATVVVAAVVASHVVAVVVTVAAIAVVTVLAVAVVTAVVAVAVVVKCGDSSPITQFKTQYYFIHTTSKPCFRFINRK